MANPNGNPQNLKPVRSVKEAKKKGRAGGKASGVARAKKKTLKQELELLMSLEIKDEKLKKKLARLGGFDENAPMTNQMGAGVALFGALLKGNVKAYEIMQATLEQTPKKEAPSEQSQRKVEIVDDLPDDES